MKSSSFSSAFRRNERGTDFTDRKHIILCHNMSLIINKVQIKVLMVTELSGDHRSGVAMLSESFAEWTDVCYHHSYGLRLFPVCVWVVPPLCRLPL